MIWKEAAVASFKVLYHHLPGVTEETTNTSQNILFPGRDSNHVPVE